MGGRTLESANHLFTTFKRTNQMCSCTTLAACHHPVASCYAERWLIELCVYKYNTVHEENPSLLFFVLFLN